MNKLTFLLETFNEYKVEMTLGITPIILVWLFFSYKHRREARKEVEQNKQHMSNRLTSMGRNKQGGI